MSMASVHPKKGSAVTEERIRYLSLARDVEDFLFYEADLIDDRQFEAWLELFSEDVRYWMPIRKNLPFAKRGRDITGPDDIAWIDDDKVTLTKRVKQILTGIHWAEEPLSRVSRLVSNVRLDRRYDELDEGDQITVFSHLILHRNRLERETDFIASRRIDVLRKTSESFVIARRKIIIDQSVLLAKNLTVFF